MAPAPNHKRFPPIGNAKCGRYSVCSVCILRCCTVLALFDAVALQSAELLLDDQAILIAKIVLL